MYKNLQTEKTSKVNTVQLKKKTFEYEITQTEVKINDHKTNAILNTGAKINLISYDLAVKLNLPIFKNLQNKCISLANDHVIKTKTTIQNCMMEINGNYLSIELITLENAA